MSESYIFNKLKDLTSEKVNNLRNIFQTDDIDELKDILMNKIDNNFPLKFKSDNDNVKYKESIKNYNSFIENYKKYMSFLITKKLVDRKIRVLTKKNEKINLKSIWEDSDNYRWDEDMENMLNYINTLERNVMRQYSQDEQRSYFNDLFNNNINFENNQVQDGLKGYNIGAFDGGGFSSFASVQTNTHQFNHGYSIYNDIKEQEKAYINNEKINIMNNIEYNIDNSFKQQKEDNNDNWDNESFIEKNKNNFNKAPEGYMLTNSQILNNQNTIPQTINFDINKIIEERNNELNRLGLN